MAAGTALSRVLGFVRAAVLITAVGVTTPAGDAFTLANTVPSALYLLLAGGVLNAVLVPQVVRAIARDETGRGGAEYIERLVTLGVLLLGAVTAALTLGAPLVVWVFGGGLVGEPLSGAQLALTVAFAQWCLPQVLFYALYALLGQVLNARGSYGPYTWAPVVNNVVGIAGIAVFLAVYGPRDGGGPGAGLAWTPAQVALLAGSATLGVVAQALVLLVPLRRLGLRLRPRLGVRGMGLRSAGRAAGWTFAALVVGQVGWVGMTSVASSARVGTAVDDLGTAGVAAWGTAYLVFMLPHSLVAVSVVTALFTPMSAAALAGDTAAVRASLSGGLRTIGVASVLSVVGVLVLAVPAVVFVVGDGEQGRVVARVLVAMVAGLVPFSAQYLVQRVFYAEEDARTPFLLQCVAVGVWVAGTAASAALLGPADRLVGVAASMSLGTTVAALLGLALLRRRLGGVDGRRVLRTHVRLVLAGAVAGAVGAGVARLVGAGGVETRLEALPVLALVGPVVVAAYLLLLRLLRVEEVAPLLSRLPLGRRRGRGASRRS
jgi:putative peptidoglycan lipid II flippase